MQELIEKKHDFKTCKYNSKENGNIFHQEPTPCLFFDEAPSYLLKHESINIDGIGSASGDENSKMIADFRIQLIIMEDIKDEIIIGCRKQEDQPIKEFESNLQTL